MPLVYVDVSVYSSPTSALGNATGDLLLGATPNSSADFPWPPHLKASNPAYFTGANAAIESIGAFPGGQKTSVSLAGIVCSSEADARRCAGVLESIGLSFYEYPGTEA